MCRMTQQQREAMITTLHNPLLIQKILKCSTEFKQLKIYRHINRELKSLSDEVIVNSSCVRLRWSENEEPFHKASDPNLTLRQLNEILDESPNFPTSHFILSNVRRLGHAFSFFHSHGLKVKTLNLTCTRHVTGVDSENDNQIIFFMMLNQLMPNLQDLTIDFQKFFYWHWDPRFQFSLPSLKSFGFCGADETAQRIIQGSPNLESITSAVARTHQLEMVSLENKNQTVRSLDIDRLNSNTLVRFVRVRAHLHQLIFSPFNNSESVPVFNALLDTHKDTLERLELADICSLPNIQIPILKKLKRLKIGNPIPLQCLPSGVNLSEIFPNLRILNCVNMQCHETWAYNRYFPQSTPVTGTLPSVDTLMIRAGAILLWMEKLRLLCPNFKTLECSFFGPMEFFASMFHRWSHVESYVFSMGHSSQTIHNLDPIFTGFSVDECKRLRATQITSCKRVEGYEQLQVRKAIYDATKLKTLKIRLSLSPEDVRNCYVPISHLSGLYGFSRLPGLKVSIDVYTDEDQKISATNLVRDKIGLYADAQFGKE